VDEEIKFCPGDIDFVSPTCGDVNRVRNAFDDRVSISIQIYGGNIRKIRRQVFSPVSGAIKDFVSGYSNMRSLDADALYVQNKG
jgi:predicted metal-dependent enzyme (double-stranded beta helix superfamily)